MVGDPHDRDEIDVARAGVDLVDARRGPRSPARSRGSVGGGVDQHDRGDHHRLQDAVGGRPSRQRQSTDGRPVGPGRAHGQPAAPRRGQARPRRRRGTSRVPGRSSQRMQQRRPPRRAPPRSGPAPGSTVSRRRDAARRSPASAATPRARHPGRGEPAVADHRELPAAAPVGPRGDQLGDRGQRAPAAAPRSSATHQAGEPVPAARRLLEPLPAASASIRARSACQRRRRGARRPARQAADAPGAYSSTSAAPRTGRAHRPSSASAHGAAPAPRAGDPHACTAAAARPRAPRRRRRRRPAGDRNGPSAPSRAACGPPTAAGTPRRSARPTSARSRARERRL